MPKDKVEKIPFTDYRLGRHISHDLRSAAYSITATLPATRTVLKNIRHPYLAPAQLNQEKVGACTGFALAHALNSAPNTQSRKYTEADALGIYKKATELDSFPGSYLPDDTGSSGLSACKAAKDLGYIGRYDWAFGFDAGLDAIQVAPLMIGTRWYSWMYKPDLKGKVRAQGTPAGGHQYLWTGIELVEPFNEQSNLCWFLNSWGTSFGKGGSFSMSFADVRKLLADNGDLVRPIPI